MLSREEVSSVAADKEEFYKLMKRNKFFVPDIKSHFITLNWMYKVAIGEAWCPKQTEM